MTAFSAFPDATSMIAIAPHQRQSEKSGIKVGSVKLRFKQWLFRQQA
ncbi:MAG: hypothetical protein AAFQ61_00430 [Cyanobacteria bacterium J06626_23]